MARLTIFLPDVQGGGAERMLVRLANEFNRRGHKIEMILAQAQGPYMNEIDAGVNLINLHTPFSSPRVIWRLAQRLRTSHPEALLTAMTYPNIAAILARLLAGNQTRLLLSERVVMGLQSQHSHTWRERLKPFAARLLYGLSDSIVAISKGVAQDLVDTIGLPRERIRVIYNPAYNEGIDRDWTVPDHPWYSQGQPAIVLGVGRLVRQKNFMNLLDAFARVRTQRPARLIILGKGPLRTELLAHARNLGIAADVSLPGFIHHPYSYMRHANVFVLSSDWEGFGNVIVEAMANGCPVVSTDCPSGPHEILDGGRYGPLVPVNAPSALAEAILKVLAQPIEKKLLQARASEFSIKSAANAYLEMLLREPTPQPTAKVTT